MLGISFISFLFSLFDILEWSQLGFLHASTYFVVTTWKETKMKWRYHIIFCFLCNDRVEMNNLKNIYTYIYILSDQISRSVTSDSLRPHESQHARPPCPSPTPGVHSDSRPSSQWCHPAISSSVVPIISCPNPSQHQSLFQWVNSLHEVAKVLEFQL